MRVGAQALQIIGIINRECYVYRDAIQTEQNIRKHRVYDRLLDFLQYPTTDGLFVAHVLDYIFHADSVLPTKYRHNYRSSEYGDMPGFVMKLSPERVALILAEYNGICCPDQGKWSWVGMLIEENAKGELVIWYAYNKQKDKDLVRLPITETAMYNKIRKNIWRLV